MDIGSFSVAEFVLRNWQLLTIPAVSAVIGLVTNWVAIQMLLYPSEYRGLGPYLGWRGIIPANAEKVASGIVRLITTKLVNLNEMFSEFAGHAFVAHADESIDKITDMVVHDVSTRYAPMLWGSLNDESRAQARAAIRREVQSTAAKLFDDLGKNVTNIIDLEHTVVMSMRRDKALLGRIFLTVGSEEFKFIEHSGAYFGFLFGIPMIWVWMAFPSWWLLPVTGFAVGYATNWLALKMIFEPKEPIKVGPFSFQGLFHKRQQEVAEVFALMVAEQVINADNIIASVTTGKGAEVVRGIVRGHIDDLVTTHEANPMIAMGMTAAGVDGQTLRVELDVRVYEELPKPGGLLYVFADKGVDVRDMLFERMKVLDPRSFEGLLRPAFQQDEWKLILAGGVLGLLGGWLQAMFVFGDQLAALAAQNMLMP